MTLVDKVIVHPIKNGKNLYDRAALVSLTFSDIEIDWHHSPDVPSTFTLETTEKGGEFTVERPFLFKYCAGKLWSLDRTKESKSYFSLYNSGRDSINSSTLHVHLAVHGPFITFSLGIDDK